MGCTGPSAREGGTGGDLSEKVLEAFGSRGEGDYLTSPDLEDAVVVIDGRPSVEEELTAAPRPLRRFVSEESAGCLRSRHFVEALPGYFAAEPQAGTRAGRLLDRLREIAGTLA